MAIFNINGVLLAISSAGYQTLNVPAPPSGYDFATAIAAVPFTINQPAAPTITSEATCTTVAEVNTSLAVNGRRTIIAAGTYNFGGAVTIGGNDKEIVCQPGAILNLTEFQPTSVSRLNVEDAVINATGQYGIRFTSSQDIAFNGLVLDAADSGFITFSTTRVRFLSSEVTGAVHAGYFDAGNSHFTIANSNFVSTQPFGGINGWCIRWGTDASFTASVLMDSRFRAEQNVTLRYEVVQQDGYFARNQIEGDNPFRTEGRDDTVPETWPLDNLHFIDNRMYPIFGGGANVIVSSYPRMTDVTATGNRTVGPTASSSNVGFPSGQTGWTLSDNSHITTTLGDIPAWVMQ